MSSRVLGVATRERYRVPVLCLLVAISAMPGLALGPARACVDFLDGGRVIAADTGPPALCTQPQPSGARQTICRNRGAGLDEICAAPRIKAVTS